MLRIRRMTQADIPFGMLLVEIAGWNQRSEDWERLLQISPEGCFLAEWDGQPAATGTAVAYGSEVAWVGMVLVHPDFRRRGIGGGLIQHCIEHLRAKGVQTIKLDATDQGREVYMKQGFVDEYGVTRFVGQMRLDGRPVEEHTLRPLTVADVPTVARLDGKAFGADRRDLLGVLARQQPELALVAVRAGQILGYGFGRPGRVYGYIGPIVADEVSAGQALAAELYQRLGRVAVLLDAAEPNVAWCEWLQARGMLVQRRLTRMFLGTNEAAGDVRRTLAFSAFETG